VLKIEKPARRKMNVREKVEERAGCSGQHIQCWKRRLSVAGRVRSPSSHRTPLEILVADTASAAHRQAMMGEKGVLRTEYTKLN